MGHGSSSNSEKWGGLGPITGVGKGRGVNNAGGFRGQANNGGIFPGAGRPDLTRQPQHSGPHQLPYMPPQHSTPHPLPFTPGGSTNSVVHSQPHPLPQPQPGIDRQQFLDARNDWRDMRDQFRAMGPGEGRRDMRDDFRAAREQFGNVRDQYRGSVPQNPDFADPFPHPMPQHSDPHPMPQMPGSAVHGGFGPQAFGVRGGTGPMPPEDWIRNLFRRGR